MKNGKSATDIPMECIKHAMNCKEFSDELVELYATIWETKQIPKEWGHSKLVALWKGPEKGKVNDPESYRALQIGSSLCKIMVVIIINRLKKWYESQLLDQQNGFRSSRGTSEGLFIAKSVQQIADKMKKKVYALFVDLSSAFDHVEREWLFKSIANRFPSHQDQTLIQLFRSLYSCTTTSLAETPMDKFNVNVGVRQGGPESPILYNLYMDIVMRIFINTCKNENLHFLKLKYKIPKEASSTGNLAMGNFDVNWIGYADDILVLFDDIASLKKGIRILSGTFQRFRLEVNPKKTKTMIINKSTA